jgi:hypothetical protein
VNYELQRRLKNSLQTIAVAVATFNDSGASAADAPHGIRIFFVI